MRTISKNSAHRTTKETRWRAVVTKCDERTKEATKFGNVVIIENRRKSEAAKVEVLLYNRA
jgi:hypothetical protein